MVLIKKYILSLKMFPRLATANMVAIYMSIQIRNKDGKIIRKHYSNIKVRATSVELTRIRIRPSRKIGSGANQHTRFRIYNPG